MKMSRANNYTWEDLGQVVGPQGPAGPAGGGSIAEKKDFSGGSYDPLSGQYTNKTKDQILNEVYKETDNGTNPKEYYGGISEVGDEAVKELFGVNDVAPNSMTYVDYHKNVKFDGKATEYMNLPYTNTFLFAVISGGNAKIYDSGDKTKRQCVVINGAITASTTTMQELVVGAGGATVTLKDGENSAIPYVIDGVTSESGVVTLNEGDVIHIKEYSNGTNYYNNAYQNVPYFMSTDTNCIHDYLSDGLFAAPSGENGAISHVMVMAGSGMIEYVKANYSYQKEYKFTCKYSDPNYNQKCVEATYGYATYDSTLQADKLNPIKDDLADAFTTLNFDYRNESQIMSKIITDTQAYKTVCGKIRVNYGQYNDLYKDYFFGDAEEIDRYVLASGVLAMTFGRGDSTSIYIDFKKYSFINETRFSFKVQLDDTVYVEREFYVDSSNNLKRINNYKGFIVKSYTPQTGDTLKTILVNLFNGVNSYPKFKINKPIKLFSNTSPADVNLVTDRPRANNRYIDGGTIVFDVDSLGMVQGNILKCIMHPLASGEYVDIEYINKDSGMCNFSNDAVIDIDHTIKAIFY